MVSNTGFDPFLNSLAKRFVLVRLKPTLVYYVCSKRKGSKADRMVLLLWIAYLGSSVASASETTPITATSTISGCSNKTPSNSAGGTMIASAGNPIKGLYVSTLETLISLHVRIRQDGCLGGGDISYLVLDQFFPSINYGIVSFFIDDCYISGLEPPIWSNGVGSGFRIV